MIVKKRVINVSENLQGIKEGEKFFVVKRLADVDKNLLIQIGFPETIKVGITLLGRVLGPVSRVNVYGSFIKLKNLPKETKYREVCITDWRGDYHYVDVPYKRWRRKRIPAPEIELTVLEINGVLFITSHLLINCEENNSLNKHVINLFLEYFGDCDILNEKKEIAFKDIPICRVNWDILPPGEYPWEHIPSDGIKSKRVNKSKMQKHTFDTINNFHPERITIGRGGFRGYIIFHFPKKNVFLLEHILYGNATYVFDQDWESFSQLTKSEILNNGLQQDRILHTKGWEDKIKHLLS